MMRFLLPLTAAAGLLVVLGFGLTMNPRLVPSPLINKPAPAFTLPTLGPTGTTFTQARFGEHPVSIFNVWASWCVACRQEHPLLMRLSQEIETPIYGLNYKDSRANAHTWLRRLGNPYRAIAFDQSGTTGIDWGVYGVPETYIVDNHGIIRYKQIGPITERVWRETLQPLIERLQKSGK